MSVSPLIPVGAESLSGPDRMEFRFRVPEDYPYLKGHFPGNPIVPGVVQIGWAQQVARRLGAPSSLAVARFRFVKPVRPGQMIAITAVVGDGRYLCETRADGILASKGALIGDGGDA